jgi:tetratricopeptide (TPR) repeat protein
METDASAAQPHWPMAHVVLLILLLLLAAFLGSFQATNNDIWMQLATGRLLARGEYTFGVDPFSWATAGRYWANPSWGYAWLSYGLYTNFGAAALSAFNALLVVLTAIVLLRVRPAKSSPLLSFELVGLSLLAASPRFALQSHMVSMAFLAGLLLLLYRGGVLGGGDRTSSRVLCALPALFAAWANLDGYLLFGLLILALTGLGLAMMNRGDRPACAATFGIAALASVAACCLNPHHIHVLAPPPDFGALLSWLGVPDAWTGGGAALREIDTHFEVFSLHSPLTYRYLTTFQAASLTFLPLWLLHAGSLVLLRARTARAGAPLPWPRLLLGVFFAALALLQTRMIAWFALVCGPLTVLNLLDAARLKTAPPDARRTGFMARLDLALAVVVFVLACILAWPGWLHAPLFQIDAPRRVAWGIREDASLRDLALAIAKEDPGNVFNANLEIAPYCAWHAPRSRTYLDARFSLFLRDFGTFTAVEDSLAGIGADRSKHTSDFWRTFFKKHDVRYLALTNHHNAAASFQRLNSPFVFPRERELLRLIQSLWHDQRSWAQLFNDGRSVLFAVHLEGDNAAQPLWDRWERQAFGKEATKVKPNLSLPPRTLGDLYFQRSMPLRRHGTEAAMLAHQYLFVRERWIGPYRAACLVAARAPALMGGGIAAGLSSVQLPLLYSSDGRSLDDSEAFDLAAWPLLMIRSARNVAPRFPRPQPYALGPNPNRYLALGYLLQRNLEDTWTHRARLGQTRLHVLRTMQVAAAARRAVQENDDDEETHEMLARLMTELQLVDLQLTHRTKIVEARKRLEAKLAQVLSEKEVNATDFAAETRARAQAVKDLEALYARHKRLFDDRAKEARQGEPADSMLRYQLAVEIPQKVQQAGKEYLVGLGLGLEALKNLESAWATLPADAPPRLRYLLVQRILQFYLQLGMVDEAEQFRVKNFKDIDEYVKAGDSETLFLLVCLTAAQGNYEQADRILAALEQLWAHDRIRQLVVLPLASSYARQTQLASGGGMAANAVLTALQIHEAVEPAVHGNVLSEYQVLRGMLALEAGETDQALQHFQDALASAWKDVPFPERIVAEKYVQLLKKQRDG